MATEVQCYVCGEHKRSTNVNGWWVIEATLYGFSCEHMQKGGPQPGKKCACGAAHAGILFQRYMDTGTLEKEVHAGKQSKPVGLTEETLLAADNSAKDKGQNGSES